MKSKDVQPAAKQLNLSSQHADIYLPGGGELLEQLRRTTHLGIGAHQDDLEFMAMHGIQECLGRDDLWFGGITCTDGAGSARKGPFAEFSDEEMQQIRVKEQREAASIGQYSYMAQLAHSSAQIKDPRNAGSLVADLLCLLQTSSAEVVYTHNLADKHATHIAVAAAVIKAIRSLSAADRPSKLIGCEVWRDLDWLADDKKLVMDLGNDVDFAGQLNEVFQSQLTGKRYDLAVEGRRRANATFLASHTNDEFQRVCFGMDLTPLIVEDDLSPVEYTLGMIRDFEQDVLRQLTRYF